jgi:hypothetical protein
MGTGSDDHVQAFADTIAAFNAGDSGPFLSLLDEKCNWPGVGTTAGEIKSAFEGLREQGWVRHDVLSVTSSGSLMVELAHNTMADGTTWGVGGVLKFADNGKLIEIHSTDERPG